MPRGSAGTPGWVGPTCSPLAPTARPCSLLWLGEVLGKWPALCVLSWAGRRKHRGHLVGGNNTPWVVLEGSLQVSHPNSRCPGCVTSLLLLLFHSSVRDSAESHRVCVPCLPLVHIPLSLGIVSDSENCPEMRTPYGNCRKCSNNEYIPEMGSWVHTSLQKGCKMLLEVGPAGQSAVLRLQQSWVGPCRICCHPGFPTQTCCWHHPVPLLHLLLSHTISSLSQQ